MKENIGENNKKKHCNGQIIEEYCEKQKRKQREVREGRDYI